MYNTAKGAIDFTIDKTELRGKDWYSTRHYEACLEFRSKSIASHHHSRIWLLIAAVFDDDGGDNDDNDDRPLPYASAPTRSLC